MLDELIIVLIALAVGIGAVLVAPYALIGFNAALEVVTNSTERLMLELIGR